MAEADGRGSIQPYGARNKALETDQFPMDGDPRCSCVRR